MEENIKKYTFKYDKSNSHVLEDVSSAMKFKQVT